MRSRVLLIAALVTATLLSACNRNTPPAQPQPAATPSTAPPAPVPATTQPPQVPPGTEVPVTSINSVMLNRPQDAPGSLFIDVSGAVPSTGWTNPRLVEDSAANSDPSVKTYKFVATSPPGEKQDHSPQTVEAELRVDSVPVEIKSIRVTSASNEISAPVTE